MQLQRHGHNRHENDDLLVNTEITRGRLLNDGGAERSTEGVVFRVVGEPRGNGIYNYDIYLSSDELATLVEVALSNACMENPHAKAVGEMIREVLREHRERPPRPHAQPQIPTIP